MEGPTNGRTNQWTDQPTTDKVFSIGAMLAPKKEVEMGVISDFPERIE
jgi:hypothetical protein